MTPAQQQLYFRTWAAVAKAHGWNSVGGIAAALADHHAGRIWESPELNRYLTAIYSQAESLALDAGRSVTADHLRYACAIVAIGRRVSSKAFSNADFDRVLPLLRLLANPADLRNLIAVEDDEAGERRRHVHVITQAPAAYWHRIARDKFGHHDLDRLTLEQLRQLSMTLRNRQPAGAAPQTAASPHLFAA